MDLNTASLGKVVYHNFAKIQPQNGKGYVNKIPNDLAFIGTKALGFDTYVQWNKKNGKFFINSNNPNLSRVIEELNKVSPDSTIDVRGVFAFGKVNNLTEEQFLNTIDPNILKNVEKVAPEEIKPKLEKERSVSTSNIKVEDAGAKSVEKPTGKQGEKKKPEVISGPLATAIERFTRRYDLKTEDLEKISGFNDLTVGQKAIVLENFNQISYGKIREAAFARLEKEKQTAGGWARAKHNLFRKETYYKAEAAEAKELFKGGIAAHGDELKELVRQTKESGVDAMFNKKGKLEILFAGHSENLTVREKEAVDRFNAAAAKFVYVGGEGKFGMVEKYAFRKAKQEYDQSFKKLLVYKNLKYGNDEKAALEMIGIDKNVHLSQLLNSEKDVEDVLSRAELENFWQRAWHGTATARERGIAFGIGFAARSAAMGALGLVAAPLVAAGMGGYSARKRAIESLKEESLRAEGGEKLKTQRKIKTTRGEEKIDLLNVVDGNKLTGRLEQLVKKIDAATTEEEKNKLRGELNDRLFYTQAKLESGLVNFGSSKDRLANEYALVSVQSRGAAEVALLGKETRTAVMDRLGKFLKFKEGKVDTHLRRATIKGAAMSAGFAIAGYAVRDVLSGFKGVEHMKEAFEKHPTVNRGAYDKMFYTETRLPSNASNLPPVIDRGVSVPIPEAVVHANYSGVIPEHGSAWEAAKSIGLNRKEFAAAWDNPKSIVHTLHGPVQIHDAGLVHKGDVVNYVPGKGGKAGHFEITPASGKPIGIGEHVRHFMTDRKWTARAHLKPAEIKPLIETHPIEDAIKEGRLTMEPFVGGKATGTAPQSLFDTIHTKTGLGKGIFNTLQNKKVAYLVGRAEIPLGENSSQIDKFAHYIDALPGSHDAAARGETIAQFLAHAETPKNSGIIAHTVGSQNVTVPQEVPIDMKAQPDKWAEDVFGKPTSGRHENMIGYQNHPPAIPTTRLHPPGNPIEVVDTSPAEAVHGNTSETILIRTPRSVGEMKFNYDHDGTLVGTSQEIRLTGYDSSDYFAQNADRIITDHLLSQHIASESIDNLIDQVDHVTGPQLATRIDAYHQIMHDPTMTKETSYLFGDIKRIIGDLTKAYGPDVINRTKLAEFLK